MKGRWIFCNTDPENPDNTNVTVIDNGDITHAAVSTANLHKWIAGNSTLARAGEKETTGGPGALRRTG